MNTIQRYSGLIFCLVALMATSRKGQHPIFSQSALEFTCHDVISVASRCEGFYPFNTYANGYADSPGVERDGIYVYWLDVPAESETIDGIDIEELESENLYYLDFSRLKAKKESYEIEGDTSKIMIRQVQYTTTGVTYYQYLGSGTEMFTLHDIKFLNTNTLAIAFGDINDPEFSKENAESLVSQITFLDKSGNHIPTTYKAAHHGLFILEGDFLDNLAKIVFSIPSSAALNIDLKRGNPFEESGVIIENDDAQN